jgi:hypothetical protein
MIIIIIIVLSPLAAATVFSVHETSGSHCIFVIAVEVGLHLTLKQIGSEQRMTGHTIVTTIHQDDQYGTFNVKTARAAASLWSCSQSM